MIELVHAGRSLYMKSGSLVGVLYEIIEGGRLKRSDWGKVENALERGEEINIRQPNQRELAYFNSIMDHIEAERKKEKPS